MLIKYWMGENYTKRMKWPKKCAAHKQDSKSNSRKAKHTSHHQKQRPDWIPLTQRLPGRCQTQSPTVGVAVWRHAAPWEACILYHEAWDESSLCFQASFPTVWAPGILTPTERLRCSSWLPAYAWSSPVCCGIGEWTTVHKILLSPSPSLSHSLSPSLSLCL